MTARETAAAVRAGERSARSVVEAHLAVIAAARAGAPCLQPRDGRVRTGHGRRGRRCSRSRRGSGRARRSSRSRSRTTSAPAAFLRPARRGSSKVGSLRTRRPWCSGCSMRVASLSARRTSTSSRWAPPRRTPRSARLTTRVIRAGSPAGRVGDQPPRSRPGSHRSHSVRTRGARSASPRRCAASSG